MEFLIEAFEIKFTYVMSKMFKKLVHNIPSQRQSLDCGSCLQVWALTS